MKVGTKNMLFESVFGRAKHCCCLVCCHGHGVAHSLSVSTSLAFFSREYADAFMVLCNCGTKETEELGNARSNKNRRGVQDVKEYLYSQCQDWFELGNVPQHIMNITTCQRASTEAEHSTNCIPDRNKVIFNDVVKELLGETPAKHFLGTSNEMQGVGV